MANERPKWKSINMGEILPCQSFLRKNDGEVLKLSTVGGVTVGQDCYYLPVDEVINVIKDYPVEESEDERITNNIKKVIGWYRGIFAEKNLMPEQYQEIDAWLDKKSERKHQYKSRQRYVGEGKLLGKKESTAFSGDENIRKALVEMVHDTVGDSLWVDYNVHKEDAIAWLEKQGEQKSAEWSEEDDEMLTAIMCSLDCSKLKRVWGKQTEDINTWLKSLKDRYTWKPSDVQMEALKSSTYCQNEQMSKVLFGLYQDLKKLREK